MNKATLLLLTLFFASHSFPRKEDIGLSGSRIFDKKWETVVSSTKAVDSIVNHYIVQDKNIELNARTYDILSDGQKVAIKIHTQYDGARVSFFEDDDPVDINKEHPTRLIFKIYDRYFDRLKKDELVLEVIVSRSALEGTKYLYLLKKESLEYKIQHLIGEVKL